MLNRHFLRQFYLAALYSIAFFLPLSVWMLTFFIIAMSVGWIADGGMSRITELVKAKRLVLIFCGIYIVYLIWMILSSDMSFGLRELRLKLPLLIFPVVIGLSDPLDKKEINRIMIFFVAGVVISSLTGFILYNFSRNIFDIADTRKMSPFISNLTLAEMTDFALVISLWQFISDRRKIRFIYLGAAIWLTFFIFLLLSLTGIIIFALLLFISIIIVVRKSKGILLKTIVILSVLMFFIFAVIFVSGEIKAFYKKGNSYAYPLKETTLNGNIYTHYPERKDIENGNSVWIYICEKELRKEWNLRSTLKYDSVDLRDQQLRFTLIRYLTSAGLTKDSSGVARLSEEDIRYIENGITNRLFTEGRHIKSRLYEIIWQIDFYCKGGNPSGHSLSQRAEYYNKGWHLFKNNWLYGTGTGDIKNEFKLQFRKENALLDQIYVYLPHNQYLTFLISFGVFGFIIICCSVFIPLYKVKTLSVFLFQIFLLIVLVSMLGEDSLETHPGVSFFAYFYAVFVFGSVRIPFTRESISCKHKE
jgi:O-antigen ligase